MQKIFKLDDSVYRVDKDAEGLPVGVFKKEGDVWSPAPGLIINDLEFEGLLLDSKDIS